jgi:hypothetical protein
LLLTFSTANARIENIRFLIFYVQKKHSLRNEINFFAGKSRAGIRPKAEKRCK